MQLDDSNENNSQLRSQLSVAEAALETSYAELLELREMVAQNEQCMKELQFTFDQSISQVTAR